MLDRSAMRLVSAAALCALASTSGACHRGSDPDSAPPVSGTTRVVADDHGFTPPALAIPQGPAGTTTEITFVRTTDKTCATEVVFPELSIKKELPLNAPVAIAVPSDQPRTLKFQCGMGMYKGALVIK